MLRQLCVVLVGSLVTAVGAEPLLSVDELLKRASEAVQQQSYKGRFTYEAGGALETLEIVHSIRDGVERERIHHLNGVKREFIRAGRRFDCVSTGNFLLRGGLISVGGNTVSLSQNYHFYIRGDERIAGRDAAVIQVVPKDEFRYGVMLAIDKDSYLPLMSLTTSGSKNVLERYQAVQLHVGEVDASELTQVDEFHRQIDGSLAPCAKLAELAVRWRPLWVPSGFVVSHSGIEGDMGESITYTDGIASFTVFVKATNAEDPPKQGAARRGATTAFLGVAGNQAEPISVVLIGEVPVKTAQQIVSSVQMVR